MAELAPVSTQGSQLGTRGRALLPLLTCLTALGSVSVSIYLPSLPELSQALNADPALIKLSLTAFLFVFAFAQLGYGPLSDRLGRRPPIIAGLLIYVLGSIACALAWTAPVLIASRILQALGAAAGPALGRAVLRDLYSGVKLTSSLSVIAAAVALSPMLGPVLGGYLQIAFGWRSSFIFLSVSGALLTLAVFFMLSESSAHIDVKGLSLPVVLGHYKSLLTDREYVAALLCGGFLTAGNFAWNAGAPFLFASKYHFTADHYGTIALIVGSGYVAGTFASGVLSRRMVAPKVVYIGMALSVAACLFMNLPALAGTGYVAVVAGMVIFTAGMGVVIPLSAACALSRHPEIAGAAAGLLGALQIFYGCARNRRCGFDLRGQYATDCAHSADDGYRVFDCGFHSAHVVPNGSSFHSGASGMSPLATAHRTGHRYSLSRVVVWLFSAILGTILAFGLSQVALHAQSRRGSDVEIWNEVDFSAPVIRKVTLTVPVVLRNSTPLANPQLFGVGPLFDIAVVKGLTVTTGYLFVAVPNAGSGYNVHVPLAAITFNTHLRRLRMSDRNRAEGLVGLPQDPIRYRNKLVLDRAFHGEKWQPFLSDEGFYDWSQSAWTQNRFQAGLDALCRDCLRLDVFTWSVMPSKAFRRRAIFLGLPFRSNHAGDKKRECSS